MGYFSSISNEDGTVDDEDMDFSDSSDGTFPSDANWNTKSKLAFNSDLQKVGVIKLNPL